MAIVDILTDPLVLMMAVVVALAALIVWLVVRAQDKAHRARAKVLRAHAAQHGWSPEPSPSPGLEVQYPDFAFLRSGHQRRVSQVYRGEHRGHPFRAFAFWSVTRGASDVTTDATHVHFAVVVLEHAAALPFISLRRRRALDRLATTAEQRRSEITLGFEAIDKTYSVLADDEATARELLDARVGAVLGEGTPDLVLIAGSSIAVLRFGWLTPEVIDGGLAVALTMARP